MQRALAVIACLALVLALCVPSLRGHRDVFDVLAVMDITQSMNVLDYRLNGVPASRLAFAKHALREGLLRLPCGSKLGLAVFSERRTLVLFTPVEVCRNRSELMSAINALGGQMAWANASEIARGLHGALKVTREVQEKPALVFITDGHEAPPLNARYRPRFEGRPGEVHGFVMGAGDGIPRPIPKIGPDGNSLGFWRADEVLQTDLYSQGRAGSISGEPMVDTGGPAAPLPADQPGGEEQLSALHERYLELLASETGLSYRRLTDAASLAAALTDRATVRHEPAPVDVRWAWGTVALVALLTLSLPLRPSSLRNGKPACASDLEASRPPTPLNRGGG